MTNAMRVEAIAALIFGILCVSISGEYLDPLCGLRGKLVGTKIVNGKDATLNFHPWMAYLHSSTKFICGGSLIHRRFILTAAHCVGLTMKARLGEYDSTTRRDCTVDGCSAAAEEYEIDMALRHGGFSMEGGTNDIALLRLKRSVVYKDHIRPICIIVDPWNRPAAQKLIWYIATGWGDTKTNQTRGVLQELILERFPPKRCENIFQNPVHRDQFCAGSAHGDTCNGDSGGPLSRKLSHMNSTRFVQFGVVSYGSLDCSGIGVYTDVMFHTPWIKRMVQRYSHWRLSEV